ncbi:uncharacterized protein BKA55DRAFT_697090 [Fusarium redolens]|uniref:Copper-fist domain-containing protein n=1 Tax=Fusarium redolens TaxID=48865 RepID=A0A9P9FZ90_FUSRE|nr:uncharacterized protein BKA55DRAFT_697090 [Fusarium redolens]KAH7224254.1 hypothetical protein BKA55DRAFT_697090 [Fusarium redolens]
MRTNEQGEKVACFKCREGHRTTKCVDGPGHQDDVQVISPPGRPVGARTNPVVAAARREKKRKRLEQIKAEEEAEAFQRGAQAFFYQRPTSAPEQRNFVAGYQQFPVPGPQNFGGLANLHAAAPSFPRRSTFPPDPLPAHQPDAIQHFLRQTYYGGMAHNPVPPVPAVSVPVSPLPALDHAVSFDPYIMDNSMDTGFQVPMPVPGFPLAAPAPAPSLASGVFGNSFDTSFQHPMPAPGYPLLRPLLPVSSVPASQTILANQVNAMAQNPLAVDPATVSPQAGMVVPANPMDDWMNETIREDRMGAGQAVPPVSFPPPPRLFPINESRWDEIIPEQIAQPIPAANHGVQSSGSSFSSGSWVFVDHSSSSGQSSLEVSPTMGPAALGAQANEGAWSMAFHPLPWDLHSFPTEDPNEDIYGSD